MVKVLTLLASIAANTKVDVLAANSSLNYLRSSNVPRQLQALGLSGATVNTADLDLQIDGFSEIKLRNGVTNTAGAQIKSEDALDTDILIDVNETLSIFVENTTGGALQFYIYLAIEEVNPNDF